MVVAGCTPLDALYPYLTDHVVWNRWLLACNLYKFHYTCLGWGMHKCHVILFAYEYDRPSFLCARNEMPGFWAVVRPEGTIFQPLIFCVKPFPALSNSLLSVMLRPKNSILGCVFPWWDG